MTFLTSCRGIVSSFSFICYLLVPYVIFCVVKLMLTVRKAKWAKIILCAGCFIFAATPIYIGDPVNLPPVILAFTLAVLFSCEGTWLQKLSIALILASLGLSFDALIDKQFITAVYGCFALFRFVLWSGVYLSLKYFAPRQEYNLPVRLWILVDVLNLTPFAATLIIVLLGSMEHTDMQSILLLPVVTITSFGLLWAVVVLSHEEKLEQEKSFYSINQKYYQNLDEEQFQVRRLRHDMANHLEVMTSLPENELRKYLKELIDSPAMQSSGRFCENNVVNAVLSAKKNSMEKEKIKWEFSASLPAEIPVEGVDLCGIFANSLDNAIEACEKLPEEERMITLKTKVDKGLLVLQVQNAIKEKPVKKNGLFATAKQDTKAHGFGLLSIQEIVKRYDGSMSMKADDGKFTLLMYLTLND